MPPEKFKLLLCDLGNVLVNFDHRIAVRRILNFTDRDFQEVYQLFFDSPLTKDFEEGRVTAEKFFAALTRALALKNLSFEKFIPIWNEIFFDNEGVLGVLQELKGRYRLHLVSNINRLHYEYLVEKFPAHFKVFDKVYLSCDIGRRKPDEGFYRAAIEEAGYKRQEVLYTDDRKDLVEEAQKLGIKSVVFKNTEDFRKRLKKMKVLE